MKRSFIGLIAIISVLLPLTTFSLAKTEWQVLKTLKLAAKPVDMLISTNNRWIYILNDQQQLLIYELNGRLKDTIDVGGNADQIKAGPRQDLLFLLSRESGTVQIISVNMIEEINVQGAPFKGPPDAPITITVFSDFQ